MNKLLRNTLIPSSLWVLILITGIFYIYGHQKKIRTELQNEKIIKSKRLDELKLLQNDLSELQNYYKRLHDISLKYKGTLASFESPGETFDYIRRELKTMQSSIKLDMDFIKEEPFKSMMKRQYELQGTGKFVDIYNLLWFLENGPVFYKILSVSANEIEKSNRENIRSLSDEGSFNLIIVGFDRTEGPKITEINRNFGKPKNINDIFNNKTIFKNNKPQQEQKHYAARTKLKTSETHLSQKPKNKENTLGLPEINTSCQVLAITPFSVLLKDAKGKLVKLRKGDKVFEGNLAELNTQSGQAVFKLNNHSGNKEVILTFKK